MRIEHDVELAPLTTLRVGGRARRLVVADTDQEIIDTVRDCDTRREPLLVLGGGSNILIGDAGFDGTVLLVRADATHLETAACAGATITLGSGHVWDDFVALAVERGWVGVEALSGIPGTVGATPIQNVGAYGQDVSQTIARVRTFDRTTQQLHTFHVADLAFGYRDSVLKQRAGRYVVLDVQYQLKLGTLSAPIAYAELAKRLGVALGERAPLSEVRDAVLELRRAKGMVLDASDHDTWSAGSFFTNPVVEADRVPADAPAWPQADGRVKVSAAWLVEHAGFPKGFTLGGAGISTKHALALTNRGHATAADIVALAERITERVEATLGIRLAPEPVSV